MPSPLLLLDTGSPLVSVALALDGAVAAARSVEQHRSSTLLLDLVREVPLAPAAAPIAGDPEAVWDLLTSAVYSRPPAISLPRPRVTAAP